MKNKNGLVVVISGPSGVGKGSVSSLLRKELPDIEECITCTTRKPREGEKDGKDYFFLTREEFEARRKNGFFLESALVHGNLYGTPRDEVESLIKKGKLVLLEIDVQGGINVKRSGVNALGVFLMPPEPALEYLEKRLEKRGTETPGEIRTRTKNALGEIARKNEYDAVVTNDDLRRCTEEVKEIIMSRLRELNGE
ncbi:MAG: guanylate kinase [Abditibacteriota bacterium]|nr:guanylate kinase [Abditibacteriota bacterium]